MEMVDEEAERGGRSGGSVFCLLARSSSSGAFVHGLVRFCPEPESSLVCVGDFISENGFISEEVGTVRVEEEDEEVEEEGVGEN